MKNKKKKKLSHRPQPKKRTKHQVNALVESNQQNMNPFGQKIIYPAKIN